MTTSKVKTEITYGVADEINGIFFRTADEKEARDVLSSYIADGCAENAKLTAPEGSFYDDPEAMRQDGYAFADKDEADEYAINYYHLFRITKTHDEDGDLEREVEEEIY